MKFIYNGSIQAISLKRGLCIQQCNRIISMQLLNNVNMDTPHSKNGRYWKVLPLVAVLSLAVTFTAYAYYGGSIHPVLSDTVLRDGNIVHADGLSYLGKGSPHSGHGYIMSVGYMGQLGADINGLLSMQCWAASYRLPVYIVQPFTDNSRNKLSLSKGVRSGNMTKLMRFSDFFDIDHFNQISVKNGSPPFVSWENFIQNAPRNIIVININMKCHGSQVEQSPEFRMTNAANDDLLNNKWLQNDSQLQEAGFSVVKAVSIKISTGCQLTKFQLEQFYAHIFQEWDPTTVTVIFSKWQGGWDGLHNPDGGIQCKDPTATKFESLFRPSSRLLRDAQYYIHMFLSGGNKVAVMVRTEHTLVGLRHHTNTTNQNEAIRFEECLRKTVELGKELGYKTDSRNTMFLTLDVGKYGSIVMQEGMHGKFERFGMYVDTVKGTVSALYGGEWTFEEWESSFVEATGGIENMGYIASLQRTIASQADCLVLMGGGTYQRLAYAAYQIIHPDISKQCVHFLCFENLVEFGLTAL